MAEFVDAKEKYIKSGDLIEIKNNGVYPFEISTGIVFKKDGEYHVSVHNGKIIITTIEAERKEE